MITCRTLGPITVEVDGASPPTELLWRKNLALLFYLGRAPRRTRSREHLVGLLWGDRPEAAARHSLREAVRVLRRAAGEEGVETTGDQLRLTDGVVELDVDRFTDLASRQAWAEAAALVAGEFLEGFSVADAPAFDDWLAAERAAWRRASVDVLVRHSEALSGGGALAAGADAAQRALALDPASDAAARALMTALALAGERAAALEAYATFGVRRAELGAEPDEATRRLAERIRRERVWRTTGPAPTPEGGASTRRAPIVGREAELRELLVLWEVCRTERRATLAVLEGDGGVGKTRLAEEVAGRSRLDGATTSAVRAVPADAAQPWSGILGLARGGLIEAAGVAGAAPAALAALATRLGDWAERFPGARVEEALPPGPAFSDVLRAALEEQPLLLAVDDAHWLDQESLDALGAALRDLSRAPVFILITSTPHPGASLEQLAARAGRDLAGTVIALRSLRLEALREMARWALPSYTDLELDRVARRISTDSAGLPLLAVELLHAVALGLNLQTSPGAWPAEHHTLDQTLPGELPQAVVAAIGVGVRRLRKEAQAVLAAASVLGDRPSPAQLARGCGLAEAALNDALDELEFRRWLVAEPRGYAFVARIVRDIVAQSFVTPGQRKRIREAAGD